MKRILIFFSLLWLLLPSTQAQGLAGFHDQRNFFHIFNGSSFELASVQPVQQWKSGYEYLAYIDNRNFLMIYYRGEINEIPQVPSNVWFTRHLMAYSNGGSLFVLDEGIIREKEAWFRRMLATGDSVLVYEDQYNRTMLYASGDSSIRLEEFPIRLGPKAAANIVAYTDELDQLKVWHNGERELVESSPVRSLDVGDNIVAYVDNTDYFKVWYKGDLYDLQSERPAGYYAGENLVAWVDRLGRFVAFYDGQVYDLLDYKPKWFKVTENLVYYVDDFGNLRLFYEGEKHILTRYEPEEVMADQDILIWPDLDGYIWGWVDGKKQKLSDEIAISFNLSLDAVVYNTNPFVFKVWYNGKNYRYTAQ